MLYKSTIFDKFPKEFQDGFRKSLSSGLRKPEQELANAVLAKGREAYLQKKKGNVTPDTKPTKGFEVDSGAKWKAIVDDIPKWARTTPQIQRALRQQEISESRLNIITDRAREGSTQQISRVERGFVNPKFLEKFQGEMGEVRGEHRFLQGKDYERQGFSFR